MKTIHADLFINNADYVDLMYKVYEACSDKTFPIEEKGGNVFFSHYLDILNKNIYKKEFHVEKGIIQPIEINTLYRNKIILLFSGGKDSIASALALRKAGWEVILYFLDGINLGYSNEKEYALKFAEKYNYDIIVENISISGTQDFLENPCKNQLILAKAIQRGAELGIYQYAYGGFESDTIAECSPDRNFSDCFEVFNAFVEDMRKIFKELTIYTIFKSETESLIYLSEYDIDYLSCITPLRYREKLHNDNSEKYNVELPHNNCGSCWKCCLEYVVKCDLGVFSYNKAFYHHCLDVMRKKVPEERPYLKNIVGIRDIYDCYVGKDLNSKFFASENNIRLAILDDFDEIKKLWAKENDVLGRMFYSTVKDEILAGDMYVAEIDNKIVGFCGLIRYAKTKKIEIDGLVVDKEYRGQHIASNFMKKILEYNLPVYAEAVEGAENNKFYDKIGVLNNRYTSASGKLQLRSYEIVGGK